MVPGPGRARRPRSNPLQGGWPATTYRLLVSQNVGTHSVARRTFSHFLKDDAPVPCPRRGRISRENDLMSKARILIVNSEPSALALLSSMLRSLGHEIDEAANDRVAVRLMERGGVDLMLAGVDPADAEALELLAYMRRKHRQVPVILLLSSPMPERAKEALRLGASTVLRYPVPATELRAA